MGKIYLFNVVTSLKFRKLNDSFQEKMKSDILVIKSSPNFLIFAGKTSNIYKTGPQEYNKLLKDNITKSYKKLMDCLEKAINLEAETSQKSQLSERIEFLTVTPAFITLKIIMTISNLVYHVV